MTTTGHAADALRIGADLIEEHGWTQGHYYRGPDGEPRELRGHWEPGCAMCVLGALRLATNDRDLPYQTAVGALTRDIEALPGLVLFEGTEVPDWNDALDRTAEEVTEQMRATADRLEKEATS